MRVYGEHTQGPWRVVPMWHDDATLTTEGMCRDKSSEEAELIVGGPPDKERWICWTQTTEMPPESGMDNAITKEDRANAMLIAASPSLFDALIQCRQRLAEWVNSGSLDDADLEALYAADAALARAGCVL